MNINKIEDLLKLDIDIFLVNNSIFSLKWATLQIITDLIENNPKMNITLIKHTLYENITLTIFKDKDNLIVKYN